MSVVKILCCLLLTFHLNVGKKIKGNRTEREEVLKEPYVSSSVFRMFSGGEDCILDPLQLHTLTSCGFNSSNPLIIITHGWSVDGVMESWVLELAKAVKTSLIDVNVVITEWLSLAFVHYATAVKNTRTVGKDIAHLLQSLQKNYQYPVGKVHLIGYSLGAHVSGFAGSFLGGSEKIGRITGLDPAGPMFEGMSNTDRLSAEDAEFVDAIHTYTRESLGISVGIRQAVAHYDFYPNGGETQPGCDVAHVLDHVSKFGFNGFQQTMKCPHERSVYLFIDSLLHKDKQSIAYRCSDTNAFNKGNCLNCRKNRCNTLGYNIKKVLRGTGNRLFLKTGPRMPYKVYHYQVKIQFVNQIEPIRPSVSIFLTGTKGESGDLDIDVTETFSGNKTISSLITLDRDLGDLMMLTLYWERSGLQNVWNRMAAIFPFGALREQLTVGKISIKSGETQQRISFCPVTPEDRHVQMSRDTEFVRCKEDTPRQRRRKY